MEAAMPLKRWKWLIALCFPLVLKVGDVCVISLSAQNETLSLIHI